MCGIISNGDSQILVGKSNSKSNDKSYSLYRFGSPVVKEASQGVLLDSIWLSGKALSSLSQVQKRAGLHGLWKIACLSQLSGRPDQYVCAAILQFYQAAASSTLPSIYKWNTCILYSLMKCIFHDSYSIILLRLADYFMSKTSFSM